MSFYSTRVVRDEAAAAAALKLDRTPMTGSVSSSDTSQLLFAA